MNTVLNPKRMRRIAFFCLLIYMGLGMGLSSSDAAEMKLTLIYASDKDRAALDPRLDSIEYKLRRLFKFEHYGLIDQQTLLFTPPGQVTAQFPGGYALSILSDKGRPNNFRANLEWRKGSTRLMSIGAHLKKGNPTILGGPPYKNGHLILNIELE